MLIHFWSDNCPPCLKLEQTVLNRSEVIRAIGTNYVPLKVNVDAAPQLAEYYRVTQWPTDVIVSPEGAEIFRAASSQDPNRFIATLDQVAAHARINQPIHGSPSTEIATQSPNDQPFNRASAFPVGNAAGSSMLPAAGNGTTIPNAAATTQPSSSFGYGAPNARQQDAHQQRAAAQSPAYVSNQFASADIPPGSRSSFPAPNPVNQEQAVSTTASPNAETRSGMNPNMAMSGAPAVGPEQRSGNATTAPPPANLALDGYCSVTLVEQEKWVKGDPKWGAVHEGRTYLFTGQAEQQRFLADYDRYAPALSGVDCVKYVENGKLVNGRRAHGVFYRGQIFLFADEAALQRFWSAPERFLPVVHAAQAQQATRR